MSEQGGDLDEELAKWLKEAGRRTIPPSSHGSRDDDETWSLSPAHLFRYLEELAGRKLRSRADLVSYLDQLSGNAPKAHRVRERQRIIREGMLIGLLALAYLQYYYWDVNLQIASLQSVQVFVPVRPAGSKQNTSASPSASAPPRTILRWYRACRSGAARRIPARSRAVRR